jgi:membrane-bound lytic murein transglycosylase B
MVASVRAPVGAAEGPVSSSADSRALDLAALAPVAAGTAGMPHIARDLGVVRVDSSDYKPVADAYAAVASTLTNAQRAAADASRALNELRVERDSLTAGFGVAQAREAVYTMRHDAVVGALNDLLISAFVHAGNGNELNAIVDARTANEPEQRRVLTETALRSLKTSEHELAGRLADATSTRRKIERRLAVVARSTARFTTTNVNATTAQVDAAPPVADARAELEAARATAMVSDGDFALVALDAYRRAATTITVDQPSCALEWWGLAGISRVEGRHGTYGRSHLDALGVADPPIIGIALNGERATRVISDSDGGKYDHDPVYDRAVGPMQFIPSTWRRYAADGDGDGKSDPHNMYDATLAAATYLCRASGALTTDEGLKRAYFSYNHSEAYVANVLSWARLYQKVNVPRGTGVTG